MKRLALSVVAGVACLAGAAEAASGGRLGLLMVGRYDCELPGNAGGALSYADAAASFEVVPSSRYVGANAKPGTYLLTGDTVTMTSGPLAGTRLLRRGGKFLRRIAPDGTPSALRCVLARPSDLH